MGRTGKREGDALCSLVSLVVSCGHGGHSFWLVRFVRGSFTRPVAIEVFSGGNINSLLVERATCLAYSPTGLLWLLCGDVDSLLLVLLFVFFSWFLSCRLCRLTFAPKLFSEKKREATASASLLRPLLFSLFVFCI